MASYIIVDVQVTNPTTYKQYRESVLPTLEAYGGRYLARGGAAENLEGDWKPNRIVVLEFDSMERAKAWWSSEEYREPKKLRQSAAVTNMVVVEGV